MPVKHEKGPLRRFNSLLPTIYIVGVLGCAPRYGTGPANFIEQLLAVGLKDGLFTPALVSTELDTPLVSVPEQDRYGASVYSAPPKSALSNAGFRYVVHETSDIVRHYATISLDQISRVICIDPQTFSDYLSSQRRFVPAVGLRDVIFVFPRHNSHVTTISFKREDNAKCIRDLLVSTEVVENASSQ